MQIWWEQLSTVEQILYYIAVPSTIALLIQTLMTFLGMSGDGDFDGGSDGLDAGEFDADFEISFEIFTIRNFIAFFTFFAWGGIWASSIPNQSDVVTILLGILSGTMAMGISGGLFYFMKKMTSSGTLNLKYAVNKIGQVYIPIPANKAGTGKIQILVQGALRELDAMTNSDEVLSTGTSVQVVSIVNENMVLVQIDQKNKI